MSKTTNYNFDKQKWGHQIREDDLNRIAANLDLIDTAIASRPSAATFVVAASDSLHKERADYVCPGVDDQVVIQAVIDALTNGKIVLLEGVYYISDTIILKSPLQIEGSGIGSTKLTMVGGSNKDMFEFKPTSDSLFLTISHLTLNGNNSNNTSGNGIVLSDVNGGSPKDVRLFDIYLHSFPDCGIKSNVGWGFKFTNIVAEFSDYGIYLDRHGAIETTLTGCHITSNNANLYLDADHVHILGGEYSRAVVGAGIEIKGGNNQIIGATITENEGDGLKITGLGNRITGCEIRTNKGNGINNSGKYMGVSNCKLSSNHLDGIYTSGDYNAISNVLVLSSKHNGMKMEGAYTLLSNSIITNSSVDNADVYSGVVSNSGLNYLNNLRIDGTSQKYCILLDASANLNVLSSITSSGAITAAVLDSGSNNKFKEVSQYKTKTSGTSTGTGAQQSIPHGLFGDLVPTKVILWNIEDGANPYQSASADLSYIYITAVVNQDYGWEVEVV